LKHREQSMLRYNKRTITEEDIEVALEWVKGNLTTEDVSAAYSGEQNKSANYGYTISRVLREAYKKGLIKIK
jgi:hypothetical protein